MSTTKIGNREKESGIVIGSNYFSLLFFHFGLIIFSPLHFPNIYYFGNSEKKTFWNVGNNGVHNGGSTGQHDVKSACKHNCVRVGASKFTDTTLIKAFKLGLVQKRVFKVSLPLKLSPSNLCIMIKRLLNACQFALT